MSIDETKKTNELIETKIKDLTKKYSINDEIINNEIESIYEYIYQEVIFGFAIQIHRAAKLGYLFIFDSNNEVNKEYQITNDNDIFELNSGGNTATTSGSSRSNSNNLSKYECKCPNCNRNIGAIRFAPHLEKCMGLGRSSSRLATRRIASYNFDEYDQYFDEEITQNSLSSSSSGNFLDPDNPASGTIKQPTSKRKRLQTSSSMQNLTGPSNK